MRQLIAYGIATIISLLILWTVFYYTALLIAAIFGFHNTTHMWVTPIVKP